MDKMKSRQAERAMDRWPEGSERGRILSDEFRLSYTWLKARLWRKVGCQFIAEDLSAEAFLQLSSTDDLHSVREPRALLTTIAQRLVFDFWRRRDLERAYLAELAQAGHRTGQSEEEKFETLQMLAQIDKCLTGLPPKVRLAFLYSQLDGMTYAEISTRLGVSISMVGQYMTKALRHCLSAHSQ